MAVPRTLRIRVDLDGAAPPIWRRILVAADTSLAVLHHVIQEAFGWEDCHLHQFQQGRRRFETPDSDGPAAAEDERTTSVGQLLRKKGDKLKYIYDFGDDWWHALKLEQILPADDAPDALPRVIAGARACPPEDCGGLPGFHAFKLEQALDRSGPCVFDPAAFDLVAADARLGWLRRGSPNQELGAPMRSPTAAAAAGSPTAPANWNPLEESLAWQRLERFLAGPEWRAATELARQAFEDGLAVCPIAEERDSLLAEPRFRLMLFDYLACDQMVEGEALPVIPAMLDSPGAADLTPGATEFLATLFGSSLGLYRIEAVQADGTLRLWDVTGECRFEATPPQPDFGAESGQLLISRVLPGRNGLASLRGGLLAPFVAEEIGDFLRQLSEECQKAGGEPDDPRQLLKPCAPLLIAFWFLLTRRGGEGGLPLVLGSDETWEPGVGEYFVSWGSNPAAVATALDRSPELEGASPDMWRLPAGGGGGEDAVGWLKLLGQELFLFAANRGSMKELRETVKRAGCPGLRHRSTRYDPALDLPLYPVERN